MIPALDVGGTHVSAAFVDPSDWSVVLGTWRSHPLNSSGTRDEIVNDLVECARGLCADADASTTELQRAWGISMPGPFDYENGIGQFEGVAKFKALNGVSVGEILRTEMSAEVDRITFINDAQAFLLGEVRGGVVQGFDRVVGITLGTGIGSAFIADGAIVDNGPTVPMNGYTYLLEVGGRPMEETISRMAIRRAYVARSGDSAEPEVVEIAQRARDGDVIASQVFRSTYVSLGEVLRPWIVKFGAQAIVVGGSIAKSWDLVGPALSDGLALDGVQLRQSQLFDDAALVGAAAHAAKA